VNDLAATVATQDAGRLTKVPGIGKKTAERLLLELRDRFKTSGAISSADSPAVSGANDIVNALIALGYNEREAQFAIRQLPADVAVTEGIRHALKTLSKS